MKFSLIIPYHNTKQEDRRKMLTDLLESLPDRDDLEIILVNDNSEIEFNVKTRHTHTSIYNIDNKKGYKYAGTARNTGLEKCQGQYVFFADSDDKFDKDNINLILDKIITENKNMDIYLFKTFAVEFNGVITKRHIKYNNKVNTLILKEDLWALCDIHQPFGKIIKTSFIKTNNLQYSDTRAGNDSVFAVTLGLLKPRTEVFDIKAYGIREGNISLTTRKNPEIVKDRLKITREINTLLRIGRLPDKQAFLPAAYLSFYKQSPSVVISDGLKTLLKPSDIWNILIIFFLKIKKKIRKNKK